MSARPQCPSCKQYILQSLSKRCMYCGTELPSDMHASDEQRQAILSRQQEINQAHDLAMEAAKKKQDKKKSSGPTPPSAMPL